MSGGVVQVHIVEVENTKTYEVCRETNCTNGRVEMS